MNRMQVPPLTLATKALTSSLGNRISLKATALKKRMTRHSKTWKQQNPLRKNHLNSLTLRTNLTKKKCCLKGEAAVSYFGKQESSCQSRNKTQAAVAVKMSQKVNDAFVSNCLSMIWCLEDWLRIKSNLLIRSQIALRWLTRRTVRIQIIKCLRNLMRQQHHSTKQCQMTNLKVLFRKSLSQLTSSPKRRFGSKWKICLWLRHHTTQLFKLMIYSP